MPDSGYTTSPKINIDVLNVVQCNVKRKLYTGDVLISLHNKFMQVDFWFVSFSASDDSLALGSCKWPYQGSKIPC